MSHKITIQPDGISFDLKPSQTILEGAIAAGITIPLDAEMALVDPARLRFYPVAFYVMNFNNQQ